jgi:hypothetical protein
MEELRKHTRQQVLIPAQADTAEESVPVDIIEISIEGLRLQSKKIFSPDALVSVSIMFSRSIIFNGWVIWVLEKYLPEGHVYHTGIQIESITDDAAGILGIKGQEDLIQEILASAKNNREEER